MRLALLLQVRGLYAAVAMLSYRDWLRNRDVDLTVTVFCGATLLMRPFLRKQKSSIDIRKIVTLRCGHRTNYDGKEMHVGVVVATAGCRAPSRALAQHNPHHHLKSRYREHLSLAVQPRNKNPCNIKPASPLAPCLRQARKEDICRPSGVISRLLPTLPVESSSGCEVVG